MADWEHHLWSLHYKDLDCDDVPSVAECIMQHEFFDMPICQDEVCLCVTT